MKVVIWIGCILVFSVGQLILFRNFQLGALPAILYWGAMFLLAGWLCKKWDQRKESNNEADKQA
jgi:hypothetical protein